MIKKTLVKAASDNRLKIGLLDCIEQLYTL